VTERGPAPRSVSPLVCPWTRWVEPRLLIATAAGKISLQGKALHNSLSSFTTTAAPSIGHTWQNHPVFPPLCPCSRRLLWKAGIKITAHILHAAACPVAVTTTKSFSRTPLDWTYKDFQNGLSYSNTPVKVRETPLSLSLYFSVVLKLATRADWSSEVSHCATCADAVDAPFVI